MHELKAMLQPKVAAAGVHVNNMKLKVQGPGYLLKNVGFSASKDSKECF